MAKGKVVMTFDAETAKFIQNALKAKDSLKNLGQQAEKVNRSSKKSSDDATRGLEDQARGVANVAATYISLQGAIKLATSALDDYNERRKRASETAREGESSLGQLSQLSGGSPERMRQMMREVRKSVRSEGMTLEQAGGLQFALESMQKSDRRGLYARFHGIADPKALVESVSTMQAAMGTQETGGDQAVLAKLFAASAASKTTLQEFAPAASHAAKTAQLVGGSDEEVLAALAQLSRSTKSADVAATQIDAFSRGLIGKKEFEGIGLLDAAKAIQAKGWSNKRLRKFFGRVEGFKGYQNIVSQMDEIKGTMGDMGQAEATAPEYLAGIIASRDADPMLRQLRRTRIAEQRQRLGEMGVFGEDQLAREETLANIRHTHRGRHWSYQWIANKRAEFAAWAGYEGEDLWKAGQAMGEDVGPWGGTIPKEKRASIADSTAEDLATEFRNMTEEYRRTQTPKRTSASE